VARRVSPSQAAQVAMGISIMRRFLLAAFVLVVTPTCAAEDTSALIKRQTQEMYDSLVPGDAKIWDKYLDDAVVVTDENGVFTNKKDTVAQITPLPKGISGHIAQTYWRFELHGNVAAVAWITDEHEDFHGQHLHSLYRETAVWLKEPSGWKIIAMHTIALQQDPPEAKLPAAISNAYIGKYRAGPDLTYEIKRVGDGLVGQASGGKPSPFKLELRDVAFAPGQPRVRKIFERDANGHITGFLSRREGRDVVWTKI
jgi:ketosteroid isomerase-like protein